MEKTKNSREINKIQGEIMIKKVLKKIKDIINLPKTLYVNFICLNFKDAIKLPIKVNHNVKIGNIDKGCIKLEGDIHKYMLKLGFSGAGFVSENKSYLFIKNGTIVFKGRTIIAEGFNIFIKNGSVKIGENFYSNKNMQLQSEEKIEIGKDCLLGWNVSIRDTDGHKITKDGKKYDEKGKISIGNHVWIASHCIILKNSLITDESIVGCNSLVCGLKMEEKNSLLAGIPAKIKKNNISWEE